MGQELRPYQQQARERIHAEWENGHIRTLLVLPTGTGKTIVFASVAADQVRAGDRVLILAHRGELLEQAADKLQRSTGLVSAVEKADATCLNTWFRVVVGSVQTLQRTARLERFPHDYFGTIIIDEAHHAITDGYHRILDYFGSAKVLGVTATPDRGDMRNLGEVFDSLAFEYKLTDAIKEGYLCRIMAQTIPLKLDISSVTMSGGDYAVGDLGTALDPYLEQIAAEMAQRCKGRKTVVFLPLIKTSQKFRDLLNSHGFRAAEVNGQSTDRKEALADFDAGKYNVLCNSMLLTEGWDCPSVDCVVVLRPTKVRSLYSQMVGRGTRLSPDKTDLLLLDFLWMTDKHELCRPADLVCEDRAVARQMTENLAESGCPQDIEEAAVQASEDVVTQREEALAKQLEEQRRKKARLVDPLQYEMSIQAEDLAGYVPAFGWEAGPPSAEQTAALEKMGILPDAVESAGKASLLLGRFSCAQGKVLYINLELDRASCLHRFKDVYTALGLPPQNLRNIDIWNLRGASVPMDKLAPKLIRRAQKKGYTAVILDPIYKVITGDENSADQMAKFCNQFDLVCRALDCAVIYCHHHSKGAQGGKRSMDRASGSGVFARDPDAMLDMTELVPTDAIREQLHNKAACRVIKAMLDKRGHADAYGLDDTLSRHRMLTIAKEKLGLADLRAIDAEVAAAEKKADGMTAWRIEGTLREFARFDPVNLWFDYPVHKPDTGLLEDLQPDSDFKTLGSRGAAKRWGDKGKVTKDKKAELDTAFEACMMDGEVTVYALAEYMDLKPRTIKTRLKDDGRFWIDGEKVGRKEPGSAG